MSSVAFHSGNKTENTVYLAFGLVVSLWVIRLLSPQSFSNLETLLGMAVFWGSIVGSLLFFVRLDRAVSFSLRELCREKYGDQMERGILTFDILIHQWQFSMTSDWESPSTKFQSALNRLMASRDVHEDIWALKGWFYFLLSVPLLAHAFAITQVEVLGLLAAIEAIVFLAVFINYDGFIKRCSSVALFRTLAEDRSVMQTRVEGHSGAPSIITSEIQESIFDELDRMIETKDWLGFTRRFDALLEDYYSGFTFSSGWFSEQFIRTWAKCFSAYSEEEREVWLARTRVFSNIMEYVQSKGVTDPNPLLSTLLEIKDSELVDECIFYRTIDTMGIDETIEDSVFQAFYNLTNRRGQIEDESVVSLVLNWYQNGATRFEEYLLASAEMVSEALAQKIITVLLSQFVNESTWLRIGPKSVGILLSQKSQNEKKAVALSYALRSGNKEIKSKILAEADVYHLDFLKEVLSYLKSSDISLVEKAESFFSRLYAGPKTLDKLILTLVNDSDSAVRRNTVRLIEFLYVQEVDTYRIDLALIRLLQDPDANVREEVLRFLVEHWHKLPKEERVHSMVEIIKDTDEVGNIRRLASILSERFKE